MKRLLISTAAAVLLASPVLAQSAPPASPPAAVPGTVTNIPAQNLALSDWFGQTIYDGADNKVGSVSDVLMDQDKKASLAIVGVGGFLGIGEKNVAVPFESIKRSIRDGKVYLTMDANKDQLKNAQGLRYDRVTNSWGVDTAANTNNGSTTIKKTAP